MEKQVVSKKRVADHGEVYTGRREVNAMLDLVKQETERIESRFLEPMVTHYGASFYRYPTLAFHLETQCC